MVEARAVRVVVMTEGVEATAVAVSVAVVMDLAVSVAVVMDLAARAKVRAVVLGVVKEGAAVVKAVVVTAVEEVGAAEAVGWEAFVVVRCRIGPRLDRWPRHLCSCCHSHT